LNDVKPDVQATCFQAMPRRWSTAARTPFSWMPLWPMIAACSNADPHCRRLYTSLRGRRGTTNPGKFRWHAKSWLSRRGKRARAADESIRLHSPDPPRRSVPAKVL